MARCVWVCAAMLIAARTPVLAQENKDEVIQKLIARVEALEREVAELKQASAKSTQTTATATADPAPVKEVAAAPAAATPAPAPETTEPANSEPADASRFDFRGFADVDFDRNVAGSSSKKFALGEVDLFTTTQISPRLTFLAEAALDTDSEVTVGSIPVDVERLLLQVRGNDYFNLDIGSYRTAIGFYNTAYLRGEWLQTAVTRPLLFTFEENGGFLPLHNVGLSANGAIPAGDFGLHYVVEVGSSRNYGQPGRTGFDLEDNAAFNFALYSRPKSIPGLEIGFSVYRDRLSPVPAYSMGRRIWTAHAVYQAHRWEFLNEAMLAEFNGPPDGYAHVPGFYSQLAYRVGGKWTPYFRYDYSNIYGRGVVGAGAPQYVPWRNAETGGIRFDLTESVALKFELGHDVERLQPNFIQAAMQLAFTF